MGTLSNLGRKFQSKYGRTVDKLRHNYNRFKYRAHASDRRFAWTPAETHYNRQALVNSLVSQFDFSTARYLEIGCANDTLFDSVMASNKTGVDPASGGTHRMTSDTFFAGNKDRFDVIFIDGLHEYEQVRRDALNALTCLADGGYIGFHDLLPQTWKDHHVPPVQSGWSGDCWKAGFELSKAEGIDFRIVKIDCGIGVMRKTGTTFTVPDLRTELRDKEFDYFADVVDELPLVEWNDFVNWLKA